MHARRRSVVVQFIRFSTVHLISRALNAP